MNSTPTSTPRAVSSPSSAAPKEGLSFRQLRWYVWGTILLWTVAVVASLLWDVSNERRAVQSLALEKARDTYNLHLMYRRWAAQHGGVYVSVTKENPPNPYLEAPECDISTPSGRKLTLVNPAYMTRQVFELYGQQAGIGEHLASLKPINPVNQPDEWERKALGDFELGRKECVETMRDSKGRLQLRLMRPFFVEESCLKCHARQGYRVGDVRGGISFTIPLEPFEQIQRHHVYRLWWGHLGMWLLGLVGIGAGGHLLQKRLHEREKAEEQRQLILNAAGEGIIGMDLDGKTTFVNPAAVHMIGWRVEELIGKNLHATIHHTRSDGTPYPFEECPSCRAIQTGVPHRGADELFWRKDGSSFPVELVATPMLESGEMKGVVITFKDITRQKAMVENLRQFSRAVEQSPASIVITDPHGNIQYVNGKFTAITGYSFGEAIGKNPRILKSGDKPPEAYQELWATITAGREWRGEFHNQRKDGTLFWEAASISPIFDEKKRITHFVAVKEDVTERKRVEIALHQAKEAAEAADRAKSDFLAVMSHEIRTPLNSIVGFTDLLRETPLSEEQRDFVETTRVSSHELLALINDILDLSKIEAGRLELENIPFDPCKPVEEALDLLASRAAEKHLEIVFEPGTDLPDFVFGDPTRLKQILINLVGNGVKFTEKGEVEVTLSGGKMEGAGGPKWSLVFGVRDTGIGIAPDQVGRLFKPFSQVDSSTTRKYGGSGLGLIICKRMAELMGGRIEVESRPGAGSTFRVTIPMAEAPPQPQATTLPHPGESERRSFHDRRVLIVDDNATNRRVLRKLLERWGFMTAEAGGGADALERLRRKEAFHLGILDMMMPDMDGFQLAREIRKRFTSERLPLVLLTSLGHGREGKQAFEEGFQSYLTKPIHPSQLYGILTGLLKIESEMAGRSRGGSGRDGPDSAMARRFPARILVAEDNASNRKLIVHLLSQMGYECRVAGNGSEVLEILRQHPYDLVVMDVHMPGLDGLETTRRIRDGAGSARNCRVHIVALTADAMQGDRERCLAAGMDGYLTKPLSATDLRKAILEMFNTAAKNKP